MGILMLVVFLTLGISALCSLFEATLYSTRMGALEAAKSEGHLNRQALRLISMKRHRQYGRGNPRRDVRHQRPWCIASPPVLTRVYAWHSLFI